MHGVFVAAILLAANPYPWVKDDGKQQSLVKRVDPPAGFHRQTVAEGTFASWLRRLPVKPGRPRIRLHDGTLKGNQRAHHIVIDIDVGKRDLQQCADAVMRLRAEFLRASGNEKEVCFRFTAGDKHPWSKWKAGTRPRVDGNKVSWKAGAAKADASYANFRKYLSNVFIWAGTYSLSGEMKRVEDPAQVEIGDVFIHGGFPGHAMLVADVVIHEETSARKFLLIQSYMPAQQMHVVRNPANEDDDPWYDATDTGKLVTPEWTFKRSDLKRFSQKGCP